MFGGEQGSSVGIPSHGAATGEGGKFPTLTQLENIPAFGLRPRWWEAGWDAGAAKPWAAGDGQQWPFHGAVPVLAGVGLGSQSISVLHPLGKSPCAAGALQGCLSVGRELIWAPQSPSQWDDVVVGRAGG